MKGADKPRDIDILVIFNEGTLRERLDILQDMKTNLKKKDNRRIDIKQILLKELFDPSFLAKTGVLIEGRSLSKDKYFSETLGFKPFVLFWYTLEGLTHTEKVKFNYLLAGRTTEGLIDRFNGRRLVNGAIKIPIENSITFEEILKDNRVKYNKSSILEKV